MLVIEVIPITKGITKETLSYFTSEEVSLGALVNVPIRNKTIPAIVVNIENASTVKAQLKSASFAIRKIEKLGSEQFLNTAFMESIKETASIYATSIGALLHTFIPKEMLSQPHLYKQDTAKILSDAPLEPMILQAGFDDRMSQYKSLIREYFAKKQSVFICVPSINEAPRIAEILSRGIEKYTTILHNSQKKEKFKEAWELVKNNTHPIVIISTAKYICIPRSDISLLIMEKENSKGYKTMVRPFVDIRTFAEIFSRKSDIKIVYGDTLLRIETLYRHNQGHYQEIIAPSYRLRTTQLNEKLIDMKPYSPAQGRSFQILSDELEQLITQAQESNERICIFSARRGLAPITVCGDCGTMVKCQTCSAPITLHNNLVDEEKRYFFLCHACGERRDALERCLNCNSWKLIMLGIGIAGVEQEIQSKFPNAKILRIDSDNAKTEKAKSEIIKEFNETKGAILLGTELMLPYIEKVPHVAVVSIDALFSLPDFRMHERLLYTLLRLRQVAKQTFYIQTRSPNEKIFEHVLKGNIIDFYRSEIKEREQYQYPPFSVLIKITAHGTQETVQKEMETITNFLQPYTLSVFPAFIKHSSGHFMMHGLIKVPAKQWVDPILLEKIKSLPQSIVVSVDPESLL